jgi:hypothetical protein
MFVFLISYIPTPPFSSPDILQSYSIIYFLYGPPPCQKKDLLILSKVYLHSCLEKQIDEHMIHMSII